MKGPSLTRTRTLRRGLAAIAAAGTVLAAAACGSSAAAGSASSGDGSSGYTLHVGFISNTAIPTGPEGLALHNGSLLKGLKSQGVGKIDFTAFPNGPNLTAALQGGSVDIGILGDTPAVSSEGNGIKTRLVNQSDVGTDTYLYTPKGGVTSIAQLKGKTVATQVGSYMYRYLVSVLKEAGIYNDVKISNIYTTNAEPTLQSNGVAAYAAPAGQTTAILSKAGFPIIDKASTDHKDLLGTGVTVISDTALKAHPGLPHAWNQVRAQAIKTMNANPDAYWTWASSVSQTPVPALKTSLPLSDYSTAPFTATGTKLLENVNTFEQSFKLDKSSVDVKSWEVPNP